jgi:CBS domain-containing protein
MLARDILSEVIPILKTSDTGMDALNLMDVFKVNHLPIVNNSQFLGLISESDIYDLNTPDEPLGNHSLSLHKPYVIEDQHIFEVMNIASSLKLTVVPVLNGLKEYVGLITIPDLLHYFSSFSAMQTPGSIIVLELNERDYSFTEIAQIVEGNDIKILSSYVKPIAESTRIQLSLKLDTIDISAVRQSFERYNYDILASFMREDAEDKNIKDNYDSLMRFLNT